MQTTIDPDPQAIKTATLAQWEQSARGWNDHTPRIRAWLRSATDAMLDMAGVARHSRVLDVAAGTGDQTLDIAERVAPEGFVLATDLSPAALRLALENVARAGHRNVATRVADGESLPVEDGTFDAAVCRLGLMFFPNPLAGLREIRRALKPGGGACVMVFSSPTANPCVATLMSTALRHAGLPARDPYRPGGLLSLGKPGLLDDLFREAGFLNVATTRIDAPFRLPSVTDYVAFVRASASPVQQILGGLGVSAAQAAWDEITERLRAFDTADGWVGPNELLLTAARR